MATTDQLAHRVSPFTLQNVTFRCWVTDEGQRYEWRSTCGRYQAGKLDGEWWCAVDRNTAGRGFENLVAAMRRALNVGGDDV